MHVILWCKDAPIYDGTNTRLCCEFIDRFITCCKTASNFVDLQKHKHTVTCKKNKIDDCRFNIPYPILDKTFILKPLCKGISDSRLQFLKNKYREIKHRLSNIREFITFHEFLVELDLSEGF